LPACEPVHVAVPASLLPTQTTPVGSKDLLLPRAPLRSCASRVLPHNIFAPAAGALFRTILTGWRMEAKITRLRHNGAGK
jgi:hypothetical protein